MSLIEFLEKMVEIDGLVVIDGEEIFWLGGNGLMVETNIVEAFNVLGKVVNAFGG